MKFKKAIPHEIHIRPSGNSGYIVTVGCGIFVYSDPAELLVDLGDYLDNPEAALAEYNRENWETHPMSGDLYRIKPAGLSPGVITPNPFRHQESPQC